jgi:hypothetical protein
MKAYLDGNIVKFPNDSLTKPSFTFRTKNAEGDQAISFSGELEFTDGDADYIKSILVDHVNAFTNEVILKFVDDCCGNKEYLFAIRPESLTWCNGNCNVKAAAVEKTIIEEQLNCLKNTMIYDNYAGFKSKQHPRFAYCNELRPNYMHDALMIISIATATSITAFIPAIAAIILLFNTINTVIGFLNGLLPSSSQINPLQLFGNQQQIDLNSIKGYVDQLYSLIAGCGRKHPSPLVWEYARNVCGKCGLSFVSSIYDNPASDYGNTCYVNAPVHKGTDEADTTTYWLDQNAPLLNGTRFFDQISQPVNGKWKIVNNQVILERRDFFISKTPWIDLTTHPGLQPEGECWNWTKKPRYSYGRFEYQKDGINWVGGEAVRRWSDIVDWNIPYSNRQKDEFHPLIEFAACRFRDDGIDRDVLSNYEWVPFLGNTIKKYKRAMLMNSHNCYTPMLLIWDGNSRDNATCINGNTYFSGVPSEGDDKYQKDVGLNEFFNYPFWFNANYPGNLYDRFWKIENPRDAGFQGYDFVAKIQYNCTDKNSIDLEGYAMTSKGLAKTEVVTFDEGSGLMTIKGSI